MTSQHIMVLSNRSPFSLHAVNGEFRPGPSVGGLASALGALLESDQVTWMAAANSDAEREVAGTGALDGRVRYVTLEEDLYHRYYDDIANSTLWFVYHGMYDRVSGRPFDADWRQSWDCYRAVNRRFAKLAARTARCGSLVLVQDYHLALVGAFLRQDRPDLRICHFSHTPFASPGDLEVLPVAVARELLQAMSCYDVCGFHCAAWEAAFRASSQRLIGECPRTLVAALGPDAQSLAARAASSVCVAYGEALDRLVGGRRLVVRVDRMEPAKNLVRGFQALDELLRSEARWREAVVFVALANPSRQASPEYVSYRRHVEQTVADINRRWSTASWTPIILEVGDNVDRSLAALQRYDVLLVNPIRDGLNLVAKEGPLLNQTDGILALSRNAGAWDSMCNGALDFNPFDVFETRLALARALDMNRRERAARAAMARHGAALVDIRSWLDAHLEVLGLPRSTVRTEKVAPNGHSSAIVERAGLEPLLQ